MKMFRLFGIISLLILCFSCQSTNPLDAPTIARFLELQGVGQGSITKVVLLGSDGSVGGDIKIESFDQNLINAVWMAFENSYQDNAMCSCILGDI